MLLPPSFYCGVQVQQGNEVFISFSWLVKSGLFTIEDQGRQRWDSVLEKPILRCCMSADIEVKSCIMPLLAHTPQFCSTIFAGPGAPLLDPVIACVPCLRDDIVSNSRLPLRKQTRESSNI